MIKLPFYRAGQMVNSLKKIAKSWKTQTVLLFALALSKCQSVLHVGNNINLNQQFKLTACTLDGSANQALYISSTYWLELPFKNGSAAAGTL